MERLLVPELLDALPPASPRALHARGDLRRLNAIMGHTRIMKDMLGERFTMKAPARIAEVGAGDGWFLLSVARRLSHRWPRVETTLLDQHPTVSSEVLDGFQRIDWPLRVRCAEVREWLQQAGESFDVIIANLFLHHFSGEDLSVMLDLAARRTRVFLALEPRRSRLSLCFSRMVGLVGCNDVTRHDAPVSVRAGFAGRELSALWPNAKGWQFEEKPAGLFSHSFVTWKGPGEA
jgi:hypothetical protein